MKKLIVTCAVMLIAAVGVRAQGLINMGNDDSSKILLPGGAAATTAASIWIGLFFSTDLAAVANPLNQASDASFTLNTPPVGISAALGAGRFGGGTRTLTSVQGQNVLIQVRAWDKSFGSTATAYWNAVNAVNAGAGFTYFGASALLGPGSLGGGSLPTPNIYGTPFGFTGFTLTTVPEPSTLALGVLGALGTMVLIRRRK